MRPHARFGRGRLQRRMFFAFGASILLTIVAATLVMSVFGNESVTWKHELTRMQGFVAHRFERVWDDDKARDELATSIASDLDVDVTLTDPHKRVLFSTGAVCRKGTVEVDVLHHGELLGHVNVCAQRQHAWGAWRLAAALVAAGGVLWGAAGLTARRMTRPIAELTRVAQELGEGKLSTRVRFGRHRKLGELELLGDVMNDMASRIEKQMADQRALLATVSHEIRTPLARMRILVELSRDKGGTETELEAIDREVVEIDALVAELLAASRMDFSALTVTELSATALATQAMEKAGIDASALSIEGDPGKVRGDATLLVRAIANLLENAKRHAGAVKSLAVIAKPGRVAFVVEDEGPGLAEGEEIRIFEPFYRGRSDGTGVGLGLALVKRIAEAHGGTVRAETRAEGGARIGFDVAIEGPEVGATLPPVTRCA